MHILSRLRACVQLRTITHGIIALERLRGESFLMLRYDHIFKFHDKAEFRKEGIFFLLQIFARDVLVMKKLEIEKTKPVFIISVLKVLNNKSGLSFFDFQLFS